VKLQNKGGEKEFEIKIRQKDAALWVKGSLGTAKKNCLNI